MLADLVLFFCRAHRSFALEQGVLFAQQLQLPRVIFKSDALAVIQAVNDKAAGSMYGHLIQGILQVCKSFE